MTTEAHNTSIFAFKDAPVPFDRFAVGTVLSDPRGRRYMKIELANHYYWAPSARTDKGAYTDKEMRDHVEDDWEVWL